MVVGTWSGFQIVEPKILRASRASLQIAIGYIEVATGQPFYVLLTNLSKKQVFILKHIILAQSMDGLQFLTPIETPALESDLDTIPAVQYKQSVYRDTEMPRAKAAEQHKGKMLSHN